MDLSRLKEEVRQRVDIVDLIGQTVELRQVGQVYVGTCPFPHGYKDGQPVYDRRPSLTVYPAQQTYYCYGCGAGDGQSVNGGASDVFGWVQNLYGVDFKTAVLMLAEQAGLETGPAEPAGDVARALERVEALDAHYRENLLANPEALAYLAGRGVDGELIHYGRLGLVPPEAGPTIGGRLSIGIADAGPGGRLATAGMAYRSLDGSLPKYVNDRTSAHFSRRRLLYLFAQNLGSIKRDRQVVLVEGYFDALALYKAGISTACAIMGTTLTAEQTRLIARHARKACLWFDGDYAGRQAVLRAAPLLLRAGVEPYVAWVPGLDPDGFAAAGGNPAELLEREAVPVDRWLVEYAAREYACVVDLRSRILAAVRPVLDAMPDATACKAQLHSLLQM